MLTGIPFSCVAMYRQGMESARTSEGAHDGMKVLAVHNSGPMSKLASKDPWPFPPHKNAQALSFRTSGPIS